MNESQFIKAFAEDFDPPGWRKAMSETIPESERQFQNRLRREELASIEIDRVKDHVPAKTGVMPCPTCKTPMHWGTGYVKWARCETPDCVSFSE